MGLILGYAWDDDEPEDQLGEALHHEAGHALRAYVLGWPIAGIGVGPYEKSPIDKHIIDSACPFETEDIEDVLFGETIYGRRGGFYWSHDEEVQVCLAGPLASLRFLVDKPVWPSIDPDIGESNSELRMWLRDGLFWKIGREKLRFAELDAARYPFCELISHDDISTALAALIQLHFDNFNRIPTLRTLLRQYRNQENINRSWISNNWSVIVALAEHIQQHPEPHRKYSHYLSGKSFYKWIQKLQL